MKEKKVFAEGMCWKKIFWIFIIGCIFGCIFEMILTYLKTGDLVSRRGLIYGPFNPVYGFGAAVFALFLNKQENVFMIFIGAALLGGGCEYICSVIQEYVFGTISWDYSNKPFNFNGRTSLTYMFYWGILGVIFTQLIYPILSKGIEKTPIRIGNITTVLLLVFIIVDAVISISASIRQYERKQGIQPNNQIEVFLDEKYPDERLDKIYENKKDV